MAFSKIYDFYTTLAEDKILLSHKGVITSSLLTDAVDILEKKLEQIEPSRKTRKKIYNIVVECVQNLYHHTENLHFEDEHLLAARSNSSILLVVKNSSCYSIKTGNYIFKKKVEPLKEELDSLNALGVDELRNQFKERLKNGKRNNKGTAGLGLMDLIRKSGNKLDYQFIPLSKTVSFFCLKTSVH